MVWNRPVAVSRRLSNGVRACRKSHASAPSQSHLQYAGFDNGVAFHPENPNPNSNPNTNPITNPNPN